jgi:hypothetical protein
MAHHGDDPAILRDEFRDIIGRMRRQDQADFGPTGNYPRGNLNADDDGEIMIGITADPKTQTVLINFGKPVAWIGFTGEQAQQIADSLVKKAWELRGIQ